MATFTTLLLAGLALGSSGCAKQVVTKTVTIHTSKPVVIRQPPPSGIVTQAECLAVKSGMPYADAFKRFGVPDANTLMDADVTPSINDNHQYSTLKWLLSGLKGHCVLHFKKGTVASKELQIG